MSNISSIDDLLMGVGNSQQAETPEHKDKLQKQEEEKTQKAPIEEIDDDVPTYDDTDDSDNGTDNSDNDVDGSTDDDANEKPEKKNESSDDDELEEDEYGNKKERLPKGMRDRLERKEKQYQREIEERDRQLYELRQQLQNTGATKEVQQAVKDFKYDPNEEVSWEQQLSDFVKHTVTNMHVEQQQTARQHQEQKAEKDFRDKFQRDMERFTDFREVVGKHQIDDAMTLSLRGMNDPSAFIYAACKRQPAELERISKLPDPYARMVEMGKLEERMRRNKSSTKAPRPLGRMKEDTVARTVPKQKDTTGDDLLAKADAKRLSTVRNRHKANR